MVKTDKNSYENQKTVFLSSEGDTWFKRNCSTSRIGDKDAAAKDGVVAAFKSVEKENVDNILEVGCANGWRLAALRQRYGCDCYGIDPSSAAIAEGKERFENICLAVGTADEIPFEDGFFEVVIMGFCLYLCDRNDLFKIAYEVDRILTDGGRIYILDFGPPFGYKNRYTHYPGLYSFKMRYFDMFLWNPWYNLIYHRSYSHHGNHFHQNPNERIAVSVLGKNTTDAYPEHPFG